MNTDELFSDDFNDDEELLDDDTSDPVSDMPSDTGEAIAEEPQFANVDEFVEQLLAPVIQRKINTKKGGGLVWDSEWWHYPEVVVRLQSLHRAWEEAYASSELSAMSTWWLHHCDPMMDRILDGESGPFHRYDPDGGSPIPPGLPTTPRI
ncbi:MAG: DUF4913 domain-containing protein [Corynebacterium casei]|nr:DUF4913 domain-containing protein [Corynebacterium casei]